MTVTALKTFRPMNKKGEVVHAGQTLEVSEHYGKELVRQGMAAEGKKMLNEIQNKMATDLENKGMPATPEKPDQRAQGNVGPTKASESITARNEGIGRDANKKVVVKDPHFDKGGEDPEPHKTADNAANVTADTGKIVSDAKPTETKK